MKEEIAKYHSKSLPDIINNKNFTSEQKEMMKDVGITKSEEKDETDEIKKKVKIENEEEEEADDDEDLSGLLSKSVYIYIYIIVYYIESRTIKEEKITRISCICSNPNRS